MPNGSEMTDAMDFESKLNELHGDDLTKFIARQLYEHCEQSSLRDDKIKALEDRNNKFAGAIGGVSGILGATIVAVLDYLTKK